MKTKLFFATLSLVILSYSCKKDVVNKSKSLCPVVDVSAVPNIVKDSFNLRYPGITVKTWFNKDNYSFCAYFVLDDGDKLAQFANDGNFITEQMLINEDVQSDDNTDDNSDGLTDPKAINTGCKCNILEEGN